jgi:hypothetical protein
MKGLNPENAPEDGALRAPFGRQGGGIGFSGFAFRAWESVASGPGKRLRRA